MPLVIYGGKLLTRDGKLASDAACCCDGPPPPPPPPPCAEGSDWCEEIIGNDYPACFEVVRSETVCNGTFFQETKQFGDCNPIGSFKGPCSDPAFSDVPSLYDDCYCVSIQSVCINYAYNIVIDPETGVCTCLKFRTVNRFRTADFVFNAATCQWMKQNERITEIPSACDGFGDCPCPDPPTCTPPPIGNSYPGCEEICEPFP